MNNPIITIKNLTKVFPKKEGLRRVEVLQNINLTIHQGEFLVLLGPSGSGKSTLLRIISGLDTQSSGTIEYSKDFNLDKVSFVFQDFGILPWLTVFENVELNLLAKDIPLHEKQKEVNAILEKFGLHVFKNHFPHELSGGMKQRVGLARAFISKPDVIFLDEPFSELDFNTADNLRQILLELWKEEQTTVVMVSHYVDEAVTLADRIALFSNRPSTIKKIITNEITRPRVARSIEIFALEDEVKAHFRD
jgi:ABC-type nitrate/sulfonate/bicarbonate transport system ATPase subunit